MGVETDEKIIELHPAEAGVTSVLSPTVRRGPGKPRGLPKPPGSGRARGTRNKRTVEIEMLLRPTVPAARRRLRAIINDPKEDTGKVLEAVRLLFGYVYGRPTERREVSGPDGGPIASDTRLSAAETVHEAALAIARAAPLVACQPKVRP